MNELGIKELLKCTDTSLFSFLQEKTTLTACFDELGLKEILARWQDPKSADSIMKVQNELDETKQIVSETLEKILDRGQKLDDLVRYPYLQI